MNTQKVAITVPVDLVTMVDEISKELGMSRSKYISSVLREKVLNEREKRLRDAFNKVFSDDSIKKEQLDTASWFEGTGSRAGQEW